MCDGRCGDEQVEREDQKAHPDGGDARRRIVERTLQCRNVEGVQLRGCPRFFLWRPLLRCLSQWISLQSRKFNWIVYCPCCALKGYVGQTRRAISATSLPTKSIDGDVVNFAGAKAQSALGLGRVKTPRRAITIEEVIRPRLP